MKLNRIAIASLAVLASSATFAVTLTEDSYIDGNAFVYTFQATKILANDGPSYLFTLNSADMDFLSLTPGLYSFTGGISSTAFVINSVKLDGTPWAPFSGSTSSLPLGTMAIGPATSISIEVTGMRGASGANFNGQLVLTPVPEPETYALFMAGLGMVGFLASRRRNNG